MVLCAPIWRTHNAKKECQTIFWRGFDYYSLNKRHKRASFKKYFVSLQCHSVRVADMIGSDFAYSNLETSTLKELGIKPKYNKE